MTVRLNKDLQRAASFEKKLSAYAVAGGAALFTSATAEAALIIHDPSPNPSLTAENSFESLSIDMELNGVDDFRFAAVSFEEDSIFGSTSTWVEGIGPSRLIAGSGDLATNFPTIDAALGATPTLSKAKLLTGYDSVLRGNWPNDLAEEGILGVLFLLGGVTPTHGFIEVAVEINSAHLEVDRWGYLVPDASVPEPSSLALFALGAAGIAAWRRRKGQVH